ncbi:MAG TPA: DUF1697 domain-containing protein [Ktedonobacteraceae bacterium]|nr:DUF1697 domain-containing protein [Ktedonobacteraceae bacterium]
MATFVALFRGINVGGHQKVRMSDLKALHESLGLKHVATYIQSGNVVFSSDNGDAEQLTRQIEESFAQKFGFHVMVTIRTTSELGKIIARNPFTDQPTKAPKWVIVLFLARQPASTAQDDLRNGYAGPEELYLLGQELYIYYPENMGRTKLSNAYLDKTLKTPGTGRNWNTVLQLQSMMERVPQ